MARKRMLFVGSAAVRFALGTPRLPAPNQTVLSDANYTFAPDGRSLLSAVAASRLGFDAVLCARVGDDYYGDRLVEVCRREGLHVSHVQAEPGAQTELLLDLVEESGSCRTIRFTGAGSDLSAEDTERAFVTLPDALVVSLEAQPETVLGAGAAAKEKDLPLFIDATVPHTSGFASFPFEQIPQAELLLLNEQDALIHSGIDPSNEENRKLACYTLHKRFHVHYIVLQLGSRGCFLYDGKYFSAISSFDAETVDPAGASEAFDAALIGAYMESGDLRAAADFANTVYAKTASRHGGFRALPTRNEL